MSVTALLGDRPGRLVVEVTGEVDSYTAPLLHACLLTQSGRRDLPELIVDLTQVTLLATAGVAVLAQAGRRCRLRGARLFLRCRGRRSVLRPLQLSGLVDVLVIDPTDTEWQQPGRRGGAAHVVHSLPCRSSAEERPGGRSHTLSPSVGGTHATQPGTPLDRPERAVAGCGPSHVEGWVVQLRRKGLAESTIRTAYTVLRAILNTAVRDGAISVNPAAAIRRPKVTSRKAEHLSPAQVAELLDAARSTRYAPLFEFLVHTGLRRGKALALRWADVDLDRGVLRARGTLTRVDGALIVTEPRTAKSNRFVPISAPAERLLQNVQRAQAAERPHTGSAWHETGYVFTTETGDPCDPRNALRPFKVAAARAGLFHAGLHTLRHSAASAMLSHGVPLKVVFEILGHSSIAITGDVYGHVSPDTVATVGAS